VNPFFVVDTGFVEPDKNVCFEFQRFGRCTKGDACRFTHAAPHGAAAAAAAAGCVRSRLRA
jgi:ADP-ribosylglycohydrolase